ncbi:MAG TPA: hypothetical protein VKV02_00935 [Acidobacteriaceae bacterium]|nr:hypothetical protein [Acidobacteriaceae bacterium]
MLRLLSVSSWFRPDRSWSHSAHIRRQAVATHPALGAGTSELASQTASVGINGAGRAGGAIAPDLTQKLTLVVDAHGITRKMGKQRELLPAKLDKHSLEGGRACRRVDLQRPASDHSRPVGQAVPAQERSNARK